jgi:hypothetical protein
VLLSPSFNAACENRALTLVLMTAIYFSRPFRPLMFTTLLSNVRARLNSLLNMQKLLPVLGICRHLNKQRQTLSGRGQGIAGLP